jgi:CheY-like chemotaxis protein
MHRKRVLVIDDEIAIQSVIQACLEELGDMEVLLAGSGQEGVQMAIAESPDGILLDVSMPGMSGFETLQKLRDQAQTQTIPVAFLTARVQPEDQSRFAELQVAGFIGKPFDPMALVEHVIQAFNW